MDAREIERELNRLWRAEIEANQRAGAAMPPSRTLLHTLVVAAPDHAAGDEARAVATALSPRQPARTIVIELADGGGDDALNAAASLICVPQPNGRTQVAGELVTLVAAGPQAARRLTGALLPLLVTNVPAFLWWMQDSPVTHPLLRDLAPVLDRLIVDSFSFAPPAANQARRLAELQQAVADPHFLPILSDLAWTRLAPWRYATAQLFDAAATRPYLQQLRAGEVRYVAGPEALALLFAGWLAERLGWQLTDRAPDALHFAGGQVLRLTPVRAVAGVSAGYFAGVTLTAADGAEFEVSRHGSTCTVTRQAVGGLHTERIIPLKPESTAEWLGHELSRLAAVPTYEAALKLLTGGVAAQPAVVSS
jgi:glucose-6-phosphate dehydrogenase assembly protein OpcA